MSQPIRENRLVEAIEACRPGSDDLSDPALGFLARAVEADPDVRAVYERCQALDGRLAAAFAGAPVPEGLAGRIMARLGAAPGDPPGPCPAPRSAGRRRARRRWFAGAAVAACLAVGVAIGLVQFDRPAPLSVGQVQGGGLDFAMREPAEVFGTGELWTGANHPPDYPYSRGLYSFRGTRFRRVEGFLGRDGVAYDLTSDWGNTATLYVVRTDKRGTAPLPAGLPFEPPGFDGADRTGGYCAAAWQSDGLLYVLVVHADSRRAYDRFVQPPGTVT